jgi:tetratricopeptide (TPR) repeat protein
MMRKINLFHCLLIGGLIATTQLLAQSPTGPTPPPPPNEAAELIKQGEKLNSEGKQDEALAKYREALTLLPKLYGANWGAGVALDLKGEYEEARKYLSRAIELASPEQKQQALRTMAVSYAFESNAAEATKYEQPVFEARLAKPDYTGAAEIANELARIDLESGDFDNAFAWYEKGYKTALRKPDLTDADKALWLFRWENAQARIAVRRDDRDAAQKHVAAAKAALDKANNPDQAKFFPYLTGYVAFYSGDYKTAISDLQKADQRDPFILCLLAQAYEKNGDSEKATDFYRKVMESNAHNPANAFARPLARKKLAG